LVAVVILAAGKGTRMESDLPKVLHPLLGKPMIDYVLGAAAALRPEKTVVVVGHERDQIQAHLRERKLLFAIQEPPLGTGHAVLQAESHLKGFVGDVVILSGDVPLLRGETLTRLLEAHRRNLNFVTVLSAIVENPTGYGRIVRDGMGQFVAIVEEKEAAPEIRRIKEINSGIYAFKSDGFFEYLRQIRPDNRKREYYLTDVIGIETRDGKRVESHPLADFEEVRGINTKDDLESAGREHQALKKRPKSS
jgi:UDP-N-acetylglucosamine diphosphorylase/glucosamine-1-phosphate N-acetyltransferase